MTGSMCSAAGLCSDPLPDAGPIAGQRAGFGLLSALFAYLKKCRFGGSVVEAEGYNPLSYGATAQ